MNILPLMLTKVFNIPVLLIIWTRDNRNYQTSFKLRPLAEGDHYMMLQMTDLNKAVNRLRLFIDCQLIGEENTEVPIRDALMGRIVVVRQYQTLF